VRGARTPRHREPAACPVRGRTRPPRGSGL
jgi:hypothetical protein